MGLPKIKDMFFFAGIFMGKYPWVPIIFYFLIVGLSIPGLMTLQITVNIISTNPKLKN
jgi:hypothetical protein